MFQNEIQKKLSVIAFSLCHLDSEKVEAVV
jgi:hypothetical protein